MVWGERLLAGAPRTAAWRQPLLQGQEWAQGSLHMVGPSSICLLKAAMASSWPPRAAFWETTPSQRGRQGAGEKGHFPNSISQALVCERERG